MKKLTSLLLFVLAFSCFIQAQGELLEAQFVHNDSLRTYKLYVPDAYTDQKPWPLVIVLHGFTLNPDFMIALTGMNAVADTGHFLVAYPQGLWVHGQTPPIPPFPESEAGWNAGEFLSNNDDVSFLSKMMDKIGLSHKVDPARVYACGLSNGGYMVYRLACELSDRIAAFVSVSGEMPGVNPCFPGRPVPLMEIHGTADSIVPYIGIPPYLKSVPESIDFWVKHNHCNADPLVIQLSDVVPGDGTTVTMKKYGNCEANASVWLMDVIGAGHVWPTSYLPPPPFIGLPNDDVHGSSEIWNFFRQHVHPDPLLTQFPWHALKVPNPFGLNEPPGSTLRLEDFDGDDTTEAMVLVAGGGNLKYYENAGDDAAPNFQYVKSFPFGIPQLQSPTRMPYRYVDIDGDRDLDIFLFYFGPSTSLTFLENKGTPGSPWFGDSQPELNPFGFVLPESDSIPGEFLGNSFYNFVDIDADNDYDLFFGGHFAVQGSSPLLDENFYFYLNDDPSGKGTAPHFIGPYKNPYNLGRPLVPDGILLNNFVDMDCDGDWDLFATYANAGITYIENTGTPTAPNFNPAPVAWWVNDPPQPPGMDSYEFGAWMDIRGDGDMDYLTTSFFLENLTNGTMACQGYIPVPVVDTDNPAWNASFSLFPNPADDFIMLKFESEQQLEEINIDICNTLGQMVMDQQLKELSGQLNIAGLQPGIYLLKASAGGKYLTRKFMKM